ncbi:MAG: Flp family type IVb pilin [Xanthobacteraceae bacterium]|nr:Flp family type IVb pilin [Xanthobacteraceae bacterium]
MKLKTLCCALSRLRADQDGATAIEYAMIAAGISIAIAGTVMNLGSDLKTEFYEKLAALL